ncbi:Unknown protein, partial [Striga hermonthica]
FMVERVRCEDSPSFGVVSMDVGEPKVAEVKEEILIVGGGGHDDETHKKGSADEEVFKVKGKVLVEVDEDREWDAHVVEEGVPEVWMVEDESLRARKGGGNDTKVGIEALRREGPR